MESAPLHPSADIPPTLAALTPVAERLTRLVADLFHTPFAALTLLPDMIQWASCTMGFPTAHLGPLSATLLPPAEPGRVIVIPDLQHRYAKHPHMAAAIPPFRFYAEVPLSDPTGHVVGVLWLADDTPRILPPDAQAQLRTFADWVLVELVTRAPAWRPAQQATVLTTHLAPALRAQALRTAYGVGIVVQDATGHICASDAHATHILGLTTSQLNGRTSHDPRWQSLTLDGTPFPGAAHPAMVALRTGQAQSARMGIHKPNGRITWLAVQSQPLVHAGAVTPVAVISSFLDITQQQQQLLLRERMGQDAAAHAQSAADIQDAQQAQHPCTVIHVQLALAPDAARLMLLCAHLSQVIRTTDLVAPLDPTQVLLVMPQADESVAMQQLHRLRQFVDGPRGHGLPSVTLTMTTFRPVWP